MNTKTKLALWGMLLLLSFSYAGTEKGENVKNEAKPYGAKTLKGYAARHALSSAQYQTEVTKFNKAGYRLTYVDGYYVNGKVKFAALWEKGKTSGLILRHNLTAKQYQDEVTKNNRNGYRLVHVDGYYDGKKVLYAAIWNKQNTSGLRTRHGLTGTQYAAEFRKNKNDGYRLVHISGYGVKNKAYYAAIWKKGSSSGYIARHGLTSKQYQETVTKYWKEGYRVTQVDSYDVRKKTYYAVIMEKKSGRYKARHNMNPKNYQLEYDNHRYQGYVPISVSGHDAGKSEGYAAAFKNVTDWKSSDTNQLDAKVKKVMKDFKVPAVTIGIVKDGKLVYAKGYGYGDKEKKIIASATSLLRLASVSKPITSVAIMKLVEQGKLKLSDKVLGKNSILGTTYAKLSLGNREKAITVQQLLEHTAGGDTWDNNLDPEGKDKWSDPMFQKRILNRKQHINWVLRRRNPTHKPGTYYQYSNFGYNLLGRIIEKKTGKSYESYLRNSILKKCGISQMFIGNNKKKDAHYKEVVYYSDRKPYDLQMTRMDSHGGWIGSSVDLMKFMVRVDGQNSKKDILKKSTIKTMTKGSSVNSKYAKGWSVRGGNWAHGGSMAGTGTTLKKMDNGISYVILTNFDKKYKKGDPTHRGELKKAVEKGIGAIKSWPNLDLF
ncbi:MAG: serine hydrolase [Kordia sp.]|uniref:serine hydrolase n=1 Tax=Kordia sp. TaxID=1965332 RepID=UPI00385A1F7E